MEIVHKACLQKRDNVMWDFHNSCNSISEGQEIIINMGDSTDNESSFSGIKENFEVIINIAFTGF